MPLMTRSVRSEWLKYRAQVLDDLPDGDPILEIARLSFYSGCLVMMEMVRETGEDVVDEETGGAYLERLMRELVEFRRSVSTQADDIRKGDAR